MRFEQWWLSGKVFACTAGATRPGTEHGFDPWVVKISWRKACNPLQYSCLENPMKRGAWQATVHGVARVGHDLVTKPPPPPGPCMLCFQSVMKRLQQDLGSSQSLSGHVQRYGGHWVWGETAPCCPHQSSFLECLLVPDEGQQTPPG